MQNFEKLEVNLTPESIYVKEECGLKKHTDIWIGDCKGRVRIKFAANFLCFLYLHPRSELISE